MPSNLRAPRGWLVGLTLLAAVPGGAMAQQRSCAPTADPVKTLRKVGFRFRSACRDSKFYCRFIVRWQCGGVSQPKLVGRCDLRAGRERSCWVKTPCKLRRQWMSEWECNDQPLTPLPQTTLTCVSEQFASPKTKLGYRFSNICAKPAFCRYRIAWRCDGREQVPLDGRCKVGGKTSDLCVVATPCSGRRTWRAVWACHDQRFPDLPAPR